MELTVKRFGELTTAELYDILAAREKVFVVEQTCPYLDTDGCDDRAYHVFLHDEDGIKAYLRVLDRGVYFDDPAIGRVLTLERGKGYGAAILRAGIETARVMLNAGRIRIEAQTYAKGFYEKFGFVQSSEEFLEDGIPHIQMVLEL